MKLAEALKILSSVFQTGNIYFQLHETNLNQKSVSENEKWLESYWSTMQRYIFKCFDVCDSLNAALPIFEQRFNVSRFVRSLHLKQLEASSVDEMSKKNSQSRCGLSAAGEFLANGFYYFVNVKYDYKNRIWKSSGLINLKILKLWHKNPIKVLMSMEFYEKFLWVIGIVSMAPIQ